MLEGINNEWNLANADANRYSYSDSCFCHTIEKCTMKIPFVRYT